MAHPIATIAMNLAPFAADLVSKVINMNREGKEKKNMEDRLSKLESYELEQAQLISDLSLKVDYLEKRGKKLMAGLTILFLLTILSIGIGLFSVFLS